MHVRMLDEEASGQQEALGVVGVNLCYGAFFLSHVAEDLVESLLDNLTTRRIEIDMLEFSGIEFRNVDNRIMALKLVQLGLSGAAMFGPNREVLQPSDVLHNKAVLVERGSFRPVTYVNLDMFQCALVKFKQESTVAGKPILGLMELTMRNLLAGSLIISNTIGWPRICRGARANASPSSWVCRAFTSCSTKNITRNCPAGFLKTLAACLRTI